MRRIKILFFWLFVNRNNVTPSEMIRFLSKPRIDIISKKFIKSIVKNTCYEIDFFSTPQKLYWPPSFSIDRLDQVVCETFDIEDWHYYQKEHTKVDDGEIILDIGTAEGLFPLSVIEKCDHIYMIEPSKEFFKCLEKTFKFYSEKVSLHNVAIGNMDGEIPFDENSLDGKVTSNTLENHLISIFKVDTLLGDNKITYLKADIEGFEQEMLKGAENVIKKNKPKIAITCYHAQNNPDEIINIIKGFVPEYNFYVKGVYEVTPKPVMIHFWI